MNDLEQFYQSSFLTPFTKDRCIHCHRNDAIQLIIQMEIDGQAEQGALLQNLLFRLSGIF